LEIRLCRGGHNRRHNHCEILQEIYQEGIEHMHRVKRRTLSWVKREIRITEDSGSSARRELSRF
jgi:hypothetical protein